MSFLPDDSTSAEAIRAFDWAASPLGPRETWPPLLRSLLPVVLSSAGPKLLLWGPELTTFHNDAYLPLLGSIGCGIGRPYRELRSDIWPIVGSRIEAALSGSAQLLQNVEGVSWRNGYAEGLYATLCYTPVVGEEGQVHGVLADVYDTSAEIRTRDHLRHENERLYSLFRNAPFFVAYGSVPAFELQFANPAFSALYGNRPLVGRTVSDALPEAVEQGFLDLLKQVAATGESWVGKNVELFVHNDPDGPPDRRFLDFIYQPMLDANRAVTGIVCFGYDVTEHQLAHERAEQLHAQLLHTSQVNAMGTMAMTLAHELNQPLTAAANFLAAARRFIDKDLPQDEVRSALSQSEGQIQRAGEIIRRIRNMVAAGAPKRENVQIADAVTRSVELLRAGGECEGVEIAIRLADGADRVVADQIQLEQILLNLLRNAVEAMHGRAEKRIDVEAERAENKVRVRVLDQGCGIDPSRAQTLFEVLQPSSRDGLGVGLSLCRTMVEAHGGHIWAESAPGAGTAISFTLPVPDERRPERF